MPSSTSPAQAAPAAGSAPQPFLLTIQQGAAARLLLSYVASLPLTDAGTQLLAAVIALRAARGPGSVTGQVLGSVRLASPEGAVGALSALGWQFAGDVLGGDGESPVAVTVPNLAEELPLSGTAQSRVLRWVTRMLAVEPVEESSPSARLAALFLAAHSSNDRQGVLPDEMPEHCRQALPELVSKGFVVDLADDRYVLDESVRNLSGMHPRSHDSTVLVRVRWEVWKDGVSPALRRHAEAVEGGFNWSSQHLHGGGVCCGARKSACGDSGWSSAAAVAGTSPGQPACGEAVVLAEDR